MIPDEGGDMDYPPCILVSYILAFWICLYTMRFYILTFVRLEIVLTMFYRTFLSGERDSRTSYQSETVEEDDTLQKRLRRLGRRQGLIPLTDRRHLLHGTYVFAY